MRSLLANLRYSARNQKTVMIGGGLFSSSEIAAAVQLFEDHARLLAGLVSGRVRWEASTAEICVGGFRYWTKLDEAGCPILTDIIRDAFAKAGVA